MSIPKKSPILFDIPDGSPPDQAFLEQLGHEVIVCHGPDHGTLCPILHGDCPLVDSAHGIVFELDLDRPQHRAILSRYKEVTRRDVPIRVVTTPEQALLRVAQGSASVDPPARRRRPRRFGSRSRGQRALRPHRPTDRQGQLPDEGSYASEPTLLEEEFA